MNSFSVLLRKLIPNRKPQKKNLEPTILKLEMSSATVEFNQDCYKTYFDSSVIDLANASASIMMDAAELLYLAGTLQAAKITDEDIVVEIGSFNGRTAIFLHQILTLFGNTGTPILSIDPFERCIPTNDFDSQGSYTKYLENILNSGAGSRCMPLVAFSQDAHLVVPNKIGMLLVDGSHEYERAKDDLFLYADKVRPGGFIFVDDYSERNYPGVFTAFNEFIETRKDYQASHVVDSWFAIAQRKANP